MLLLDIIGAAISLLAVVLFTQASLWAWPVSLLANVINGVLYAATGIYGHMGLEGCYLLMNCYGWYYWQSRQEHVIVFATWRELIQLTLGASAVLPLIFYALLHYTDSTIPVLDSVTTTINIFAALLMCRGRIESWVAWFVVDSIYALIYWYKGLPFHLTLMLIYLVLAVRGYYQWQQRYLVQTQWQEFA